MKLASWIRRLPFGRSASPADDATQVAKASSPGSEYARRGNELLEVGRSADAVKAFRAALAASPRSVGYHVNLAYALQESGQTGEAHVLLEQAVALDPSSFDARYMLGSALESQSRPAEAAEHLEAAVALRPSFEPAHAQLCRVLASAGQTARAQACIERALGLNPTNADFHQYRGNLLLAARETEEAIASFRRALDLKPDSAELHGNLGIALLASKDHEAAAASFERAIALAPQQHALKMSLAATRRAQHRFGEAAALLQDVIEQDPAHAEAINQLGALRQEEGKLEEAIESYRLAIELEPEAPGAYGNLGLAFYEQGRIPEAVAMYRRALEIKPLATVHDNLGNALTRQGIVDEAIEHYRKALELDPDNLNTRCNLAGALADGQGAPAAVAAFREILQLKPDHIVARSNLLFNLCYDGETSVEEYLAEARRMNDMFTLTTLPHRAPDPDAGSRRPFRVGLVSGDLYGHPVGFFIEGILKHLTPERVELHAYSTSLTEDALTDRIRPRFKQWSVIKGELEQHLAERIRADGIDILIDLAGHSALNLLSVFAWRPAPVQVTWLGYFASTGLRCMDYVLADPVCVPPGREGEFTEKVWRLPHTRLCYTPPADAPAVVPLPASQRGHLTFGCFQRLPKINDRVLALWGRVFQALPDAKLLLQSQQFVRQRYVDEILDRLRTVGISEDRVTVRPPARRDAYMATYGEVDVVLDTFPFTGGTTTCEALWMGVPTLSLVGSTMLGRQGAALLRAAGLKEWVVEDEAAYVRQAVALTADRAALAALRAGMRERVRSSPLFETQRFARDLEAAFEGMWREVCCRLGQPDGRQV